MCAVSYYLKDMRIRMFRSISTVVKDVTMDTLMHCMLWDDMAQLDEFLQIMGMERIDGEGEQLRMCYEQGIAMSASVKGY